MAKWIPDAGVGHILAGCHLHLVGEHRVVPRALNVYFDQVKAASCGGACGSVKQFNSG